MFSHEYSGTNRHRMNGLFKRLAQATGVRKTIATRKVKPDGHGLWAMWV